MKPKKGFPDPEQADGTDYSLVVWLDRLVTGLQVQYGNPGNFSFISLRKRARCLTRCLLRVISSNGEGGEGGQSISAVRSFGAKTPVGVR